MLPLARILGHNTSGSTQRARVRFKTLTAWLGGEGETLSKSAGDFDENPSTGSVTPAHLPRETLICGSQENIFGPSGDET